MQLQKHSADKNPCNGSAIGKPARMVAAVTDEGFSAMIIKNSNKNNEAMTELTEAMTDDKG